MHSRTAVATAFSFLTLVAGPALADEADLMVVFDASGSMWGQIDGKAKIEIARDAFAEISTGWQQSGQTAGLIAYGHRRKGDCGDIELLSSPSRAATSAMPAQVAKLSPKGKTPLSAAVRMAAEELKYTENPATVILLSDGIETCDMDPCAVGADLEKLGIDFTAHVIGFDIQSDADRAQLQCLAANTGGQYFDADSADALSTALIRMVEAPSAEPSGIVTVQIVLAEAEGTARPAQVALEARNLSSGERRDLGVLQGAEQVITGRSADLSVGQWSFTAKGDGGVGEVTVDLTAKSDRITIPFQANNAAFEYLGSRDFLQGADIEFQLRSRKPLQENATFYAALVPAGATSFDENISFVYRFGADSKTTEHVFHAWEYPLEPGLYEIVLQNDGMYALEPNLGRFSFKVAQENVDVPKAAPESEASVQPTRRPVSSSK
ncbi:VWA domain-containing protein [Sulfitobacter sp. 915]|uniref:vWA domain-containing protein n=1 Tax=Sulfitobacter sp. 915 TaxID=3368558 RepID=UPI00374703C8